MDSAQPVRRPGPAILEKLPLDMAFPKEEGERMGSRVRSTSTRRGRSADVRADGEVVGERGHWRKS